MTSLTDPNPAPCTHKSSMKAAEEWKSLIQCSGKRCIAHSAVVAYFGYSAERELKGKYPLFLFHYFRSQRHTLSIHAEREILQMLSPSAFPSPLSFSPSPDPFTESIRHRFALSAVENENAKRKNQMLKMMKSERSLLMRNDENYAEAIKRFFLQSFIFITTSLDVAVGRKRRGEKRIEVAGDASLFSLLLFDDYDWVTLFSETEAQNETRNEME